MNLNIVHGSIALLLAAAATGNAAGQEAVSEETITFFEQNCASCHTIGGGRLAGPDLKGATDRKDSEWLVDFILDPKATIDAGDAYATELLRDARGVYMPKTPGLARERAQKLVELIAIESAKEESRFAGLQISDRPLTVQDEIRGEQLFRGAEAYESGAPPCLSCHTVTGLGGLGGGRLGPDLTFAYARLEGRQALAAWLSAPPSPVMQPVYKRRPLEGEEVLALVAYLKRAAEQGRAEEPAGTLRFAIAGIGGAVVLLLLLDFLWRRRYRATRRPLTRSRRTRAPEGIRSQGTA